MALHEVQLKWDDNSPKNTCRPVVCRSAVAEVVILKWRPCRPVFQEDNVFDSRQRFVTRQCIKRELNQGRSNSCCWKYCRNDCFHFGNGFYSVSVCLMLLHLWYCQPRCQLSSASRYGTPVRSQCGISSHYPPSRMLMSSYIRIHNSNRLSKKKSLLHQQTRRLDGSRTKLFWNCHSGRVHVLGHKTKPRAR